MLPNIFNRSVLNASVVINEAGCWVWVRTKPATTTGYATYSLKGASYNVHRLVFEEYFRKLEPGECVLHKCDTRLCVNPDHLFVGSKSDNNRDRASKMRSSCGENCHLSKLTESVVREIHGAAGTYRGLARVYGISRGTIKQIKTEVTWRHLWK